MSNWFRLTCSWQKLSATVVSLAKGRPTYNANLLRRTSGNPGLLGLLLWLLPALLPALQSGAAERARVTLPGHVPPVVSMLVPVGRLPATTKLFLAIGIPLRNQLELDELLRELQDPLSTNYHKYLTSQEFTERFGPTESQYQSVVSFAQSYGLRVVGTHANRVVLDVEGGVTNIERAFQITLRVYEHPTEPRKFFAPDVEPSVSADLPVADIWGMSDFGLPRPLCHQAVPAKATPLNYNGSGPGGAYQGRDFRNAYAAGALQLGSGQTAAVAEFDGYYASDIATYASNCGYTNVPLQNVLLDNVSGSPGYSGLKNAVAEVSLDIEMLIAMAPALSKVIVYEGSNPYNVFNRIATDNLAKQISCSWSWNSGPTHNWARHGTTTLDSQLQQMAAQGQSFFQASGDSDAYTGSQAFNSFTGPIPQDSTYVTSVGGTSLTMNGAGASWSSETVWNPGGNVGSGGGVSPNYAIPPWQTNVDMSANSGSTANRNIPDVALTADAVWVVHDNGGAGAYGGTSCAAPLWAGFTALVNQQSVGSGKAPVGFLNPALYAIGTGPNYAACFHDTIAGNNIGANTPGLYYAVSGYDLCTGWGTPSGTNLINALAPYPYILTQPLSQTATNGNNAIFSVIIGGQPPFGYRWLFNGADLPSGGKALGATSSVLTLMAVTATDSGSYSVIVTNSYGAVTSSVAALTVVSPPAFNTQPTNQTVVAGASVSFSATVFGTLPLAYQWRQGATDLVNGGNVSGATSNTVSLSAVTITSAGNYTLVVANPYGAATSSVATLTVTGVNYPPVLAPVSDRTIPVGMTLTITNVASDPDGDLLTFSLGPGAPANASIDPSTGVFTWSPVPAQVGINAFSVIVTDSGSPPLSATQSFSVTVVPSNSPPVLAAISNQTIAVGMTLTITNVAADPDGGPLTFSLGAGAATNAVINPTNGVFTWAPVQAQMGSNTFTVIVTDNGQPPLSATQSFSVTVVQSNSPPVLVPIASQTIAVGMSLIFTNVASDSDGDQLTFSLGPGAAANATLNPTNGIFMWSPVPAQIGSNAFTVVVTDSGLPPLSATQTFSVTVIHSNSAPFLAAISNQITAVGMTLTITNVAGDPDGDLLTFSLGAGAATNALINPTNGVFTWAPVQAHIGSNAFTVIVTDNGQPPLSATQSFSVTVVQSNSPPVLAPIASQTIAVGMSVIFTNVASDPDGDQLTFSLGPGAAANATLNPTNGIFMWSPVPAQIGSNAFTVVVTDSGLPPLSATQTFSVTVVHSNSAPFLAAISNQVTAVGMTLTITNVAGDPDGDLLTFSLGTGAATNATINPTNGVFTWAPVQDQIGSNAFTVVVTDNGLPPLSAAQSFSVMVLPSNSPPVLAPIPNQTIAVGTTLIITNIASDSDGGQLTFSLGAGAPANASIDPATGVFTWSPVQAQIGSNAFSVIVTDNGLPPLSAVQSFSVMVLPANSPPFLAAISNQTIAVGMTLTITNVAGDPDGDQLTFSLGQESPTNAVIDATNGVFAWTPTSDQIGSNAFSIIVTDSGLPPLSATQSFTVTVLASNNPPVLAPIADQTVYALLTLILTNAATDPDLPAQVLTFSLDPGAPAGASIGATDGVFTWTPTEAQTGTNSFTVRVTDNGLPNLSAAQPFQIIVLPPPRLETLVVSNSLVSLTWNSISGTTYRVQFRTNLTDGVWADMVPDVTANGATASTTDTSATNDARFYRVLVVP